MIKKMDRKTHFRFSSVTMFLYFGLGFVKRDLFFPSSLILWIAIYFTIAYAKIYMLDLINDNKFNWILLMFGSRECWYLFINKYFRIKDSFFL